MTTTPSADDFPARVRAQLARLGLSYDAASARLGAARNTVRQIRNPRYDTLCRLVAGLGMDPRALAPELFAAARGGAGNDTVR